VGWVVPLRCDGCKRVYRLRTGDPRAYVVAWQPADLPVGDRVTCHDRDGWCHRCRRPRAVEAIPPPGMPLDPARARWRAERVSPPRCLCCGSTAVEELGDDFVHPNCGGRFAVCGTPEHFSPSSAELVPSEGPPECSWLWVWWSRRTLRCS
jgi:hypothetical protein